MFLQLKIVLTEDFCADFVPQFHAEGFLCLRTTWEIHSTLVLYICVTQQAFHPMPLIAVEADCNIPPLAIPFFFWSSDLILRAFIHKAFLISGKTGGKKKMQKLQPGSSCHTPPLLLVFSPSNWIPSSSIPQPLGGGDLPLSLCVSRVKVVVAVSMMCF